MYLFAARPAVQRARAVSAGGRKTPCYEARMMSSRMIVESLGSSELRSATRELVRSSHVVEAELLVHLGEIDERKLYLDWSFSSMFAFCIGELGFSEDVACNRINVARAARRMPVILEVVRSGQVHLAGIRALAPHLTSENQEEVLAEAAGKSKREIEELVARLAPQPAVPTVIRKLPEPRNSAPESATLSFGIAVPQRRRPAHRTGDERAIRHGSEGATGSDRRREGIVLAAHSGCHQTRGLRARRRPLQFYQRGRPEVQRDRRPGIRSRRRVCASSRSPSGPYPPP